MAETGTVRIDEIRQRMYLRHGVERLGPHLEERYGITVTTLTELDVGVFAVDRADGPGWVARLFPAQRPAERAAGDGEILRYLAGRGFPAERCAVPDPVSELDGQAVLVTERITAVPRTRRRETVRELGGLRALGDQLGRLHALPAADDAPGLHRAGGGWHHLTDGGPGDELAVAAGLLADAAGLVPAGEAALRDSLLDELARLDDGDGLPEALTHPDFVLANIVASPDRGLVAVDWTGAGRAARMWSLGFLLYSAGARDLRLVDLVVSGYACHVRPEPAELDRLAGIVAARPLVLDTWQFCFGRKELAAVARDVAPLRELAGAIADRARSAFGRAAA